MTGMLLRLIVEPAVVAIIVGTPALDVPENATPTALAALAWDAGNREAMHGRQLTERFRITPSPWWVAKRASLRSPEAARRRTRPIIQ
jgi:hypothetical protein